MSASTDASDLATLSLVIPAYNEADHIERLLDSLNTELDDLVEIIVVDNMSSDDTAAIVERLASRNPKIRLIQESRRGVIAARNAGFDAAAGDIIGRIDADSLAHRGWARAVRTFFTHADEEIGAGSGLFDQHDMPLQSVHRALMRMSFRAAERPGGQLPSLFGANMAVRSSTWKAIRPILLEQSGIFDDLDITLCIKEVGQRSAYVPGMEISASGRRMLSDRATYKKFTAYLPATFAARGMHDDERKSWITVRWMRFLHLAFWVSSRAWDPSEHRYSLSHFRGTHAQRVLPYS